MCERKGRALGPMVEWLTGDFKQEKEEWTLFARFWMERMFQGTLEAS